MNNHEIDLVIRQLWPNGGGPKEPTAYAVLDGARDPRILSLLKESGSHHKCLFAGELSDKLYAAAPHIVKLTPKANFTRKLIKESWGRSWGIYVIARRPHVLEDLRKNMRKHLRVVDKSGRKLLFRFYDPRVLRRFMPTFNIEQLNMLFNPAITFVLEGENPEQLCNFRKNETGVEHTSTSLQAESGHEQ